MKKIIYLFTLIIFSNLLFNCSSDNNNNSKQNLDIYVSGRVTNGYETGIANVTINIMQGGGYYGPSSTLQATILTDRNGYYSYIIKNDNYGHDICCVLPNGYDVINSDSCKMVNTNIIDSKRVPNVINFILRQ